ncbi:phytoene/squalene synthase family protein [uncultured Enterovirga sp.]|uniref:phytoene/squalene synthase family protein n=1 Tax=uncultured Enterovirga sp. TaxID=2026352 RepID=UPI0035C991FF
MSTLATVAAASESIRTGSKSFAAASRLFDPRMRESAVMLYAWCRHCDDVIDDQQLGFRHAGQGADKASVRLDRLEAATRAALAGKPTDEPAFAALQEVVRRHAIPEWQPLQHLAGFRMDVEGRRYETLADMLDYAYHVAGIVGVMMAEIMGVREPAILDRASDLGIAFQLTNIARDIVDDAGAGRVYLPSAWLAEAGIPPGDVADPRNREALAGLASRLVAEAEPYYASAAVGIRHLPPRAAWAVGAASRIYRAIGTEITRLGPRAWDRRVSTSGLAKLGHVAAAGPAVLGRFSRDEQTSRARLYRRPRQA